MARCKAYEIQGSDPSRTAGAVRCHRTATATASIGRRSFPVCKRHRGGKWQLFIEGGWLYAVNDASHPPK